MHRQPPAAPSVTTGGKPFIDAAIAIVVRHRLVLVAQRKAQDVLGGYWEFPGGKREEGETLEQCLARELREEVDIVAAPIRALSPIVHECPAQTLRLHPFICRHETGEPKLIECQAVRWVPPAALRDYRFPPANEALIEQVIALLDGDEIPEQELWRVDRVK